MKCRKCHSHMEMTRSENSHKCVQIWYECAVCGCHMLSSTPSELFDVKDLLRSSSLRSEKEYTKRFNSDGASIN